MPSVRDTVIHVRSQDQLPMAVRGAQVQMHVENIVIPVPPQPQLPVAVRGAWGQRHEEDTCGAIAKKVIKFAGCMLGGLVVGCAAGVGLSYLIWQSMNLSCVYWGAIIGTAGGVSAGVKYKIIQPCCE